MEKKVLEFVVGGTRSVGIGARNGKRMGLAYTNYDYLDDGGDVEAEISIKTNLQLDEDDVADLKDFLAGFFDVADVKITIDDGYSWIGSKRGKKSRGKKF